MLTFCHYQIITQSINNGSHQTTLLTILIVVHSAMNENLLFYQGCDFFSRNTDSVVFGGQSCHYSDQCKSIFDLIPSHYICI